MAPIPRLLSCHRIRILKFVAVQPRLTGFLTASLTRFRASSTRAHYSGACQAC
ncbi:uncharacterized protein SETTUDRAFT_166037 [Exserohilum turcica Et28A]|uniref:Uncharacterized protein n=1 Tax=Exserohilum turcicum (strain 28A) TaxID=671987 RepID=R0JZQ7_EXST2|nr:uncharacterized protein SETTUDRAFT_166037 [Exserohilum turcica Et28A]EOA81652.1 hypothetical protein SETTUDRAFT_166037 [Exserohilum turcica Et28A]